MRQMTTIRKPRRLTEAQVNKVLREYKFEERVHRVIGRLGDLAWRIPDPKPPLPWRRPCPSLYDHWIIATKVGMVGVTVREDAIYCGFDDPKRANNALLGVNPYSGKWNHHAFVTYCHGRTSKEEITSRLDTTLRGFAYQIAKLTNTSAVDLLDEED